MTDTILLASDLTARADRPFDRAAMLADDWNANRTILFANPDRSIVPQEAVEQQLERSYGEDVAPCQVVVAHGKVPETIAKVARDIDAKCIILGAARHNNLTDFFLGTAVDYVVRHTSIPVLVVKEKPRKAYENIMVAVDFSDASANAVKQALAFFPDAKVTVAHAFHMAYKAWLHSAEAADVTREEANTKMQQFFNSLALSAADNERTVPRLIEGDVHKSIYDSLLSEGVDLLVLGTHGRSGFVQATIGSRASEMLGWSPIDVLMVRGK